MPDATDPLLQSWLDVYRALEALERRPAAIGSFRDVHAVPAWQFAVQARGPDAERRPHPGPSPWLVFARGRPANLVRQLLPLWLGDRQLCAVQLEELAREVSRDPMLQRRARLGGALMAHIVAHPVDWRWLRDLFGALHPRPLLYFEDDEDDDGDLDDVLGERVRRRRSLRPESEAPTAPPPPSVNLRRPSSRPVPGWRRPAP